MNSEPARILFVDDEIQLHDLIGGMLEELPVTMSYALTGEEGQQMIRESSEFAVIISNHNMGPGMTGVEFLKWIKEHCPKTIRILITGGIDEDSLQDLVTRKDIDDFALKPVIIDNLIKQVSTGILAYNAT